MLFGAEGRHFLKAKLDTKNVQKVVEILQK